MDHVRQVVVQARQKLYDSSGIYISGDQLAYFRRQIVSRIEELHLESGSDYLEILDNGTEGVEIHHLLKKVFIGDTRFFSHRYQTTAIVDYALPEIIHEKNCETVNIWFHGVGCGEGVYSLMLLLHEQNLRYGHNYKYNIIGSDVDDDALKQAEQAWFRWSSVSHLDEGIREKYFSKEEGNQHRFLPLPGQTITFQQLIPHEIARWQQAEQPDLILFQNILMYYGLRQRQQIAEQLHGRLSPSGYLFVGPTESLYQVTDKFRIIHFTKTLGYKKPGNG
ncbi:MAG: hypothetical protein ISR91_06475 [Candidatus Delongbacteria bacterium]|nr:hypothetical protein [Candidatus Delongbacteria bacterium]